MADGQLYEYNVSANRDLMHKAKGRIVRRFEPRIYDEWLKIQVLEPGVEAT